MYQKYQNVNLDRFQIVQSITSIDTLYNQRSTFYLILLYFLYVPLSSILRGMFLLSTWKWAAFDYITS